MFKKLNSTLLENYPLVWNMRLPSILMVILVLHFVHFAIGYFAPIDLGNIGWRGADSMFFSTPFAFFSIIISCVVFILWFIRVFRNNAFKSFYPFSNSKLFFQLFVFFSVSLLNISYYYSYTEGYVLQVRHKHNEAVNREDITTFNSMIGLLQQGKDAYSVENKCYPKPFPLTKKFKEPDSLSNNPARNYANDEGAYYESADSVQYTLAEVNSMAGGIPYSYLNQCDEYTIINSSGIGLEQETIVKERDKRHQDYEQMLKNPVALKSQMTSFLSLCDRYQIKYKINIDEWHKWVYNPPLFPYKYSIQSWYNYYDASSDNAINGVSESTEFNPKGYYVELDKLKYTLSNILEAYEYRISLGSFCVFIYIALAITLLVFGFRATSRKIWLISFIGSNLICLLIGAVTAIIGMNSQNQDTTILVFYLLTILSFFAIHLFSQNKTISGIFLNWFVWSLPFVSVIIYGLTSVYYRIHFQNEVHLNLLDKHSDVYFFVCFLIYLLIFALFINKRYRLWQAMPED